MRATMRGFLTLTLTLPVCSSGDRSTDVGVSTMMAGHAFPARTRKDDKRRVSVPHRDVQAADRAAVGTLRGDGAVHVHVMYAPGWRARFLRPDLSLRLHQAAMARTSPMPTRLDTAVPAMTALLSLCVDDA